MLGRIDIYWHDSAGSHFFISSRSAERRIPRYASDNRRRNREKWPRPFGLRGKSGVPSDRSSSLGWKSGVPSDRSSSLGWKSGVPSDRSSSLGWKSGHTSFSPSTVACHSPRPRPRLAGFPLAMLRVSICRYALAAVRIFQDNNPPASPIPNFLCRNQTPRLFEAPVVASRLKAS